MINPNQFYVICFNERILAGSFKDVIRYARKLDTAWFIRRIGYGDNLIVAQSVKDCDNVIKLNS